MHALGKPANMKRARDDGAAAASGKASSEYVLRIAIFPPTFDTVILFRNVMKNGFAPLNLH